MGKKLGLIVSVLLLLTGTAFFFLKAKEKVALTCFDRALFEPRREPLTIDHTFIITLMRDRPRYLFVKGLVEKPYFPQPYTIFPAIDGSLLTAEELQANSDIFTAEGIKRLKRGEIGCAMSHRQIWQEVAANPKWQAVLILEDDAELYPHFREEFQKMSAYLPKEWDLIYLYNHPYKSPLIATDQPYVFQPAKTSCLHGYLISQKGAKKLLKELFPLTKAIDYGLERVYAERLSFSEQLKVKLGLNIPYHSEQLLIYTLYPDLVYSGSFETNIQDSAPFTPPSP